MADFDAYAKACEIVEELGTGCAAVITVSPDQINNCDVRVGTRNLTPLMAKMMLDALAVTVLTGVAKDAAEGRDADDETASTVSQMLEIRRILGLADNAETTLSRAGMN